MTKKQKYMQRYYIIHLQQRKEYLIKNKTKIQKYGAKYWKLNKEEKTKYNKEYNQKHKKEKRKYNKEYKNKYKIEIKQQRKNYRKENRKKFRKYENMRYDTDIQYRLSKNLRIRLIKYLKQNTKIGSSVKDLGCTIPELKTHLEKQFKEGMCWENWGVCGWHIDHIIPLSKFDLTYREQFLKAVHFTNLQPLWAEDNWKKGNKIIN